MMSNGSEKSETSWPHVIRLPHVMSPAVQETQETWVRSLGQKDLSEEENGNHSSILAWKVPWTEEPDGL